MNPETLKSADEQGIDVTAEKSATAALPKTMQTALVSTAQPLAGPEKMDSKKIGA